MDKVRVIEFAGRMVVIAHIESYWTASSNKICLQMSSGELHEQEMRDEEEAKTVMKNIEDFINDKPHA